MTEPSRGDPTSSPRLIGSLKAERPPRMGVVVARAILRHIVESGMATGDRLPAESELANALGVGKGSLREGLFLLDVMGFIEVTPGRKGGGATVAASRAADFADMTTMFFQYGGVTLGDLLDMFVTMAPFAARLASERRNPTRLQALRALVEEPKTVDLSDAVADMSFVSRFHRTIVQLSGNPGLNLYFEALIDMWLMRAPASVYPQVGRAQTSKDLIRIAEAILSGNGTRAERLMREHLDRYIDFVKSQPDLLAQRMAWRDDTSGFARNRL